MSAGACHVHVCEGIRIGEEGRMKVRSISLLACAIAAAAVAAALEAQTSAGPEPKPVAAASQPAADFRPAFGETVLEITPATLDRLARALQAEESARKASAGKSAAAKPRGTPQPLKTKKEYQECQQGAMIGPEYAQLMEEYKAAISGQAKDSPAARKAANEMMAKLAAMIETACGPDPGRAATKEVSADLRKAEKAAAEGNGFTVRQFAVLKERVTPLCLSDPSPPDPSGLKIKGQGNAYLVYTAAEVAALRPRCDAFIKLLYPDQD
jgi:hypothetical protein